MTYLKFDLDKICKNWCPICSMCEENRRCADIEKIEDIIIDIMRVKIE